jgi:hypothetical protein
MKTVWKYLAVVLATLCVVASGRTVLAAGQARRVAILIGANDPPPGRAPLRYAHEDARRMADVLTRVGGFAPADVHVLLEPSRAEIEQVVALATQSAKDAGGDVVFVFYYSGHSDGQSVYPKGSPFSVQDLRARLGGVGARVTVGILDTCRGGTWTQAKGLTVGPPLEQVDLVPLTSEGTALLSSSSGLESAHEAEALRGSFFTHHLVGGLLGAADRDLDGVVTLDEAFEYAKDHTVRDSARTAATVQHPSFDVQLRGRQDVVLAQLAKSSSSLEIVQTRGPLEVIQLSSGVTVSELAAGPRRARLALPPGKYLVRKVADGKTYAKDIEIAPSSNGSLTEEQLEVTTERLALKGGEPPPIGAVTTLPRGWWELRLAVGVSSGPEETWGTSLHETGPRVADDAPLKRSLILAPGITWGITDRLSWNLPVPAFSYRFGDPDSLEVVARAGLVSFGYSRPSGMLGHLDAGVGFRLPTSIDQSLVLDAIAHSPFSIHTASDQEPAQSPTLWRMGSALGYTWLIDNKVGLAVGAGVSGDVLFDPHDSVSRRSPSEITFGSVLSLGYRPLPLVQVYLSNRFALDGYASWSFSLKDGALRDSYMVGFSWNF